MEDTDIETEIGAESEQIDENEVLEIRDSDEVKCLDFETEIVAYRKNWLMYEGYSTPIEKSRAAADYLIAHAGQVLDFDEFHKEFKITIDGGGQLYPYYTLNWHTDLWLRHLGYNYKLFCIKTRGYERTDGKKRYILVDKENEIIWANKWEEDHRSFCREFNHYGGAYYNKNFKFVSPPLSIIDLREIIYCNYRDFRYFLHDIKEILRLLWIKVVNFFHKIL